MTELDYIRDPDEIYRRSFQLIDEESDLSGLPEWLHPLAIRMIHACGMPDIVADLRWRGDPAQAARGALAGGAPVIVDARMVEAGLIRRTPPPGYRVICSVHDRETADLARDLGTTRSAAAVDRWGESLAGSVAVIGNAPTALFRLIERLSDAGFPRPAALLAFPVGFVGAADSKEALVASRIDVPFLTLLGRRGGSALAAAALNGILKEAS